MTLTHVNMAYAFHHSLAASFGLAGAKTYHAIYRNTDGIAAVSPTLCGLDDHLAREPVELPFGQSKAPADIHRIYAPLARAIWIGLRRLIAT